MCLLALMILESKDLSFKFLKETVIKILTYNYCNLCSYTNAT